MKKKISRFEKNVCLLTNLIKAFIYFIKVQNAGFYIEIFIIREMKSLLDGIQTFLLIGFSKHSLHSQI